MLRLYRDLYYHGMDWLFLRFVFLPISGDGVLSNPHRVVSVPWTCMHPVVGRVFNQSSRGASFSLVVWLVLCVVLYIISLCSFRVPFKKNVFVLGSLSQRDFLWSWCFACGFFFLLCDPDAFLYFRLFDACCCRGWPYVRESVGLGPHYVKGFFFKYLYTILLID